MSAPANLANITLLLVSLLIHWPGITLSAISQPRSVQKGDAVCDYYMCQFEEGNIDALILSHAQLSRTVMFGEIHDTVLAGAPAPVGDSLYVASLLPDLRRIANRSCQRIQQHGLFE